MIGPAESLIDVVPGGHSEDSSLREQVLEHLFLGELLASMLRSNRRHIEVLKAEVDR